MGDYIAKWKAPAFEVRDPAGRVVVTGYGAGERDAVIDALREARAVGDDELIAWLRARLREAA